MRCCQQVVASGEMAYEIEIRALQAIAYQALGETAHALNALGQAIAQGMPEGHIRLFLDLGESIIPLLKQLREQRSIRVDVAGYCTKLLVLAGAETYETYPAIPIPTAVRRKHIPICLSH